MEDYVPVAEVTLSSVVVMRVVKHARENSNRSVQGPLVGLLESNRLDVTNCFPLPRTKNEEVTVSFQEDVLAAAREVHGDYFAVGWYQVAELASFFDKSVTIDQYNFQKRVPESVVLIYDPTQVEQNKLVLKAFRLTKRAMKAFNSLDDPSKPLSSEKLKKLTISFDTLFEEVPVVIRTSPLSRVLMIDMVEKEKLSNVFEQLDGAAEGFKDRDAQLLMENIDDLSNEAYRYQYYHRSLERNQERMAAIAKERALNGLEPLSQQELMAKVNVRQPSRMEPMLLNTQIASTSAHMAHLGSQCLGTLFLSDALQEADLSPVSVSGNEDGEAAEAEAE